MGTQYSKPTENTGEIVNNVKIDNTVTIENREILILLIIIVIIKLVQFIYKVYMNHRRGLRKRYLNNPVQVNV